jgi:hypothetical protein
MRTRQALKLRREESLTALLGETRYAQFKSYEEQKPVRNRVAALGRTFAAAGQPLGDAQARALMAALVVEEKRRREFMQETAAGRQPAEVGDQMRIDDANLDFQAQSNHRLLEAVQPHLNALQLESYRAMLEQQLTQSRAALRVRREQSAARPVAMPSGRPVPQQPPQDLPGR